MNKELTHPKAKRQSLVPGEKLRDSKKITRIPATIINSSQRLPKPPWIRIRLDSNPAKVAAIKSTLRKHNLYSVCEEASCPNLSECFGNGTATFMIMGDICTRRCPFCDVAHGRPLPLDADEPENLAKVIAELGLRYVVITSVDRDDLLDGGAGHFVKCIKAVQKHSPAIQIEILVPDFRGRMDVAIALIEQSPPHIFNHNLETVPRLYKHARPGSDYQWSLDLLALFKEQVPDTPTKSGIMVGLGENNKEIHQVLKDLRNHNVNMVTIGQYLQPSISHLPVERFVTPQEFKDFEDYGYSLGFDNVASGPLVRSSYHADQQALMQK